MLKKGIMNQYIWTIAIFLLFTLGACSSEFEKVRKNSQKELNPITYTKQVNFIGQWYNEGDRELLVRNIARKYEFLHQDVKVNLKFPEEVFYDREDNESNAKFVADIITKEKPEWDIIRINDDFQSVYGLTNNPDWAKDNLVDFSQIEEFRENTKTELLGDSIKSKWGGIIPGPFLEGQYWALWFNKKVADKLNITVKSNGMTADDFINYVKAVYTYNTQNPNNRITPIHEAGDWRTIGAVFFNMFASTFNDVSGFLSEVESQEKLDNWYTVLKVAEELSEYNILDESYKNVSWGATTDALLTEDYLFYVNGSWMYNIWMDIDEDKTMNCFPAELPVFKPLNIYPAGYQIMWAVLKNAPNKETAIDFLLKMNSPEIGQEWVQTTKCPTGIKSGMADISFGVDQFEDFASHIQNRYGTQTYRYTEDGDFILGKNSRVKSFYLRDVLTGAMSAEEAMRLMR